MSEAVTFWLDNKVSSGVKVAEIGSQILVSYREKYYVVEGGAARMKGSKPLHYSKSSLPAIWKKALRGILPPVSAVTSSEDDILPRMTMLKKERTKMEKPTPAAVDLPEATSADVESRQLPPSQSVSSKLKARLPKASGKIEAKPASQTSVAAVCPYCSHKNELPLEKGKNGKPFFTVCDKCNRDFAVRFAPVTVYQAQVAAFK